MGNRPGRADAACGAPSPGSTNAKRARPPAPPAGDQGDAHPVGGAETLAEEDHPEDRHLDAIDWAEPAPGFDHYLQALMTYGFGKRILFGSDQMVWPDATAQAIARFRAAPYLTAEQKREIFFNNAVRLFG